MQAEGRRFESGYLHHLIKEGITNGTEYGFGKEGVIMERGDFISGEAWCKYKFERESKKEEIERLQRKVERASKNLHNRIVYDNIVLTVLSVTTIAVLAGWI